MTTEITDTRSKGIEPGKYTFTIASTVLKGEFKPGANYYDFQFLVNVGKETFEHNEKIPVWLSGQLLLAIGAKEKEQGVFEWDKESVVGTMFDAEIVFEKGIDKRTGLERDYRRMKNPVAINGFPKNKNIHPSSENDEAIPF